MTTMSQDQTPAATVLSLLQPLKDRLAAATPGPWHQGRESNRWENSREVYSEREVSATSRDICTSVDRPEDAALIAHAPTDQAKLIAAIEKVAELAGEWLSSEPMEGTEPSQLWYSVAKKHAATQIRAALTQALGGDTA